MLPTEGSRGASESLESQRIIGDLRRFTVAVEPFGSRRSVSGLGGNEKEIHMTIVRYGLCVAIAATVALLPLRVGLVQQAGETPKPANDGEAKEIDYKTLKSPVPYSTKSIKRGKALYKRLCVECHGPDGKSQIDVIADASDLTEPEYYYHGSTVGEVFRSIRNGAGENMPPYKDEVRNTKDLWDLVNFTRSLWPEKDRPELQDDADDKEADTETKPDDN